MKQIAMIMGLFLFFQSCSNPKLERKYFIGIWKAKDGALIEIYDNGKCKAIGLNHYNIHPFDKYKNQLLNFDGNWDFVDKDEPKLHLSYYTGETYQYKGETKQSKNGIDFSIEGQGLLQNKLPFDLYVLIGDPDDIDESNKYRFVKQ